MDDKKTKAAKRAIVEDEHITEKRAEDGEKSIGIKRIIVDPLCALVDGMLSIENMRVQSQIRLSHLALQGRKDPDGEELFERVAQLEKWCDGRIAALLKAHPAYPWFSRVKGIGNENVAKVVGMVDIEKAHTISALWKFAGYAPNEEGKAMKRVKGEKLPYNAKLRTMCWRVAGSLLKTKGKYYTEYLKYKSFLEARCERDGIRIVPTTELPIQDKKRIETSELISEGHIHNMALRKMIKLFLSHLWLVWREAGGLPVRSPYILEHGHTTLIDPWDMCES